MGALANIRVPTLQTHEGEGRSHRTARAALLTSLTCRLTVRKFFAWQHSPEPFVQSSRQLVISDRQGGYGTSNYTARMIILGGPADQRPHVGIGQDVSGFSSAVLDVCKHSPH